MSKEIGAGRFLAAVRGGHWRQTGRLPHEPGKCGGPDIMGCDRDGLPLVTWNACTLRPSLLRRKLCFGRRKINSFFTLTSVHADSWLNGALPAKCGKAASSAMEERRTCEWQGWQCGSGGLGHDLVSS